MKFSNLFSKVLCTINDGGEFQKSYKKVYLKGRKLKLEHSGFHVTFLNLDITISNGKISIKFLIRTTFLFYCINAKFSQ